MATNATIVDLTQQRDSDGAAVWVASLKLDDGGRAEYRWSAPDLVRAMAALQCSDVHFPGGRCRYQAGTLTELAPNTPAPLAQPPKSSS